MGLEDLRRVVRELLLERVHPTAITEAVLEEIARQRRVPDVPASVYNMPGEALPTPPSSLPRPEKA